MHINPTNHHALPNIDQRQPPAQAARALLDTQADLADRPFGKLVSMIARGQEPSATTDSTYST